MYSPKAIAAGPVIRPGTRGGFYPQRSATGHSREAGQYGKPLFSSGRRYSLATIRNRLAGPAAGLEQLDHQALTARVTDVRSQLLRAGLSNDDLVFHSFALVRETARRKLGMAHYDNQLLGGWVLLNGMLAEMATGEGKTLTATLAAATAALAGIPVHVITANEYLAERDCQTMTPLYQALGLTVGVVRESMSFSAKQCSYRCDVVYLTSKQVGFDYLRDRMGMDRDQGPVAQQLAAKEARSHLLLRGLCFAIVDEADSILIDEAGTPLIIARDVDDSDRQQVYHQALTFARRLQTKRHFTPARGDCGSALTGAGEQELAQMCRHHDGVWSSQRRRQQLVTTALQALHYFVRDRDYLIGDQGLVIIDPHTGRRFKDRSWPQGLQQMIECKEGCSLSGQRETLASISYQRFFRRYLKLSGMSGTLADARRELRQVYGLEVRTVPPHKPVQRRCLPTRVFVSGNEKWLALIDRAAQLHSDGKPLLIGTCSVAASEHCSALLKQKGLPHALLNARQDEHEAAIIARAGQSGSITVATNMAGRGTDIVLGQGVARLGGLHVLISEPNPSRRVDRQLQGRAGRQGDPGWVERFVSLDDERIACYWPRPLLAILRRLVTCSYLPNRVREIVERWPQQASEANCRRSRYRLLGNELKLNQLMALSGSLE